MSRGFLATERSLGRQVVIKVLPPDTSAGVNVDRFRRETQMAAQLRHPNIVPVLSGGEAGGLLYFTMPFIEGESLRDRIKRDKRVTVREALTITREVADALVYA